jgi:4-amino-4-deoxy-L-arabinose transferase-like glycosyltransferase
MICKRVRSGWMVWSVLALASVLYLGTAGSAALVDDDVDAAHALVAREMLQRHDYVVMYMDGIRYLIRPPLHFWMIAASYAMLGQTEFATRLPLALSMIGLALITFVFGARFFGRRAGYYAALVVLTSVGMFIFTRNVIPEAIYALEFTVIFYLFARAWTRPDRQAGSRLGARAECWAAAATCALAALTRGIIGVLFPVAGIFGFITLTRGWRRWRELHLVSSVAIFLAIAAPWHILAGWRTPGFYWAYFVNENINRALGTRLPHDYSAVPLGLWWVEHLAWLFPWSFFAPLLVAEFPALRTWRQKARPDEQARMLLFVWAAVIFAFFSLEGGSRMEYYSFGAWPALALLLGSGIARAERADNPWLRWIARLLAALGIVLAGAGVYLSAQLPASGDFARDVRAHGEAFYQSSMAHILDLTPAALADLRAPILIATLSIGGSFVAAWILREWKFQIAATLALAAGMIGFFLAANKAYEQFEPALSSRELAFEINKTLQPTDQIVLYGDIRVAPGVAFYSQRRVLLYDATESNLEFGSHYPDAPKTFFTDQDFPALWQGRARVLLVVPADKNEEALGKLPKNQTWILAATGGKTVYVNQYP